MDFTEEEVRKILTAVTELHEQVERISQQLDRISQQVKEPLVLEIPRRSDHHLKALSYQPTGRKPQYIYGNTVEPVNLQARSSRRGRGFTAHSVSWGRFDR